MGEVFHFITDDDKKYFDYLDNLFDRLPFDSYRKSYLAAVIGRDQLVTAYVGNRSSSKQAYRLSEQNDIVLSHFLYYIDAMFKTPSNPAVRSTYIVEAFHAADVSQELLNREEIGRQFIYEPVELETKIAEILLADSEEKAKQDIADMFQSDIHDIVRRFIAPE